VARGGWHALRFWSGELRLHLFNQDRQGIEPFVCRQPRAHTSVGRRPRGGLGLGARLDGVAQGRAV